MNDALQPCQKSVDGEGHFLRLRQDFRSLFAPSGVLFTNRIHFVSRAKIIVVIGLFLLGILLHINILAVGRGGCVSVSFLIDGSEVLLCLLQSTIGALFFEDLAVFSKVFSIQLLLFVVEAWLVLEWVMLLDGWLCRDLDLSFETAPAWPRISISAEAEVSRGANDRVDETLDGSRIWLVPIFQREQPLAFGGSCSSLDRLAWSLASCLAFASVSFRSASILASLPKACVRASSRLSSKTLSSSCEL